MSIQESHASEDSLRHWLAERVADYVQKQPQDIEPNVPLAEYGLDSVFALTLSGDIEDHLGLVLEPTVMWDYPTVGTLAKALAKALVTDLAQA
ncbi:acyl carrier protein [Endothiovibrio diazotrophicus]